MWGLPRASSDRMLAARIGLGVAIAGILGSGVYLSGKLERDSRARVEDFKADAPTAAEIRADAADSARRKAFDEQAFVDGAKEDARTFGIPPTQADAVAKAQAYSVELEEPVVLGTGRSWRSEHLEVRAVLDKVSYQKLGATVSARHSIAQIENVSDTPIAYVARVRSHDRGKCDVRGARQHNAMALMPGEIAEVVVCAGGGKIRVDRAEVLEISVLGYRYLSRVPARAAGHDSLTATSHAPPGGVGMCEAVDRGGLAQAIKDGTTRWVDVVDYYSRHSCDRFRFFYDYRYAPEAPSHLPTLPPKG